jgi:predicted metalloprotease
MRWDSSHESRDVIDRRGEQGPSQAGGGIGGLLFLVPWLMRSRFGRLILLAGVLFFVGRAVLGGLSGHQSLNGSTAPQSGQAETPEVHFVSFVLDDVQQSWADTFAQNNVPYQRAKLVLYTDSTQTGCGYGDAATGPFYCPADQRVYLDLGFFHALSAKLGARGQFAQAYVIAHEIGHHIQKQLGITQKVDAMRGAGAKGATSASVRLELQADCFAGIWAHSTQQRDLLEAGDIESAIGAAAAVGDDRLQKQATGTVSPESWTHGSSEERMRWFKNGYTNGSVKACDTFAASQL